jgi:hypothetical protein
MEKALSLVEIGEASRSAALRARSFPSSFVGRASEARIAVLAASTRATSAPVVTIASTVLPSAPSSDRLRLTVAATLAGIRGSLG